MTTMSCELFPSDPETPTPFLVVMGVSGCGKTTVADLVAAEIGGGFLEGDAFHPPANKAKMGAGIPLTDEDRWPWFDRLAEEVREVLASGRPAVLACSALKRRYREHLFDGFSDHRLVYLRGSYELIKARMDARQHEYMTSTLLQSQFDALEEPEPGPGTLILSIERTPEEMVQEIVAWLGTD